MKNALVKFLVEIVQTVVEGENDELRSSPARQISRGVGASTVTVRQTTFLRVAPWGRLARGRAWRGLRLQSLGVAGQIYQDLSTALGLHGNFLGSFKHIFVVGLVVVVLELVVDDVVPLGVVESVAVNRILGVLQVGGLPRIWLEEVSLQLTGVWAMKIILPRLPGLLSKGGSWARPRPRADLNHRGLWRRYLWNCWLIGGR